MVGTLTAPGTEATGDRTYTYTGLDLAADTTYYVVLDVPSGTSSGRVGGTSGDGETGLDGWSIGNDGRFRNRGSTSSVWSTWNTTFFVRINGSAKGTPSDSMPSFSGTISNQTYVPLRKITDLTLPAATGGDGTLMYSISPNLPAGLSFNTSTRKLSGTPTGSQAAATYTYKVTDSDDTDPDSSELTFTITITANAVPSFGANTIADQTYTQHRGITELSLPTTKGGDGTLMYELVGMLPTGLNYDSTNKKITGTPTAL